MKKLALLSAAMTLGISSWAFAADNPPPPPEKARSIRVNRRRKTASTTVSKRNTTASSRGMMASSRNETANNRSMVVSSRQKAVSTAGNHCRQKRNPSRLAFCARLFHPLSADIDKPLPFFDKPGKNLHSAWHSKPTPLIHREKVC